MTIAVTGAGGQLGRLAVQALKQQIASSEVIALVRDPSKVADLGVEARPFDYTIADALAEQLQGVETLVLISSNDLSARFEQHKNVVDAAKQAGVKRIVYTSILRADTSEMQIAQDHKLTEDYILQSGVAYTFLRNGWYLENWTGTLGASLEAGAIIGASGEGKVSGASRADFAQAIAVTAGQNGHENAIYELAGDQGYTQSQFAEEISFQTGKSIPYNDQPEETFAGILQKIGLPQVFANILADADAKAANGALFDDSKTLSKLIGRPTTSLQAAVTAALSEI